MTVARRRGWLQARLENQWLLDRTRGDNESVPSPPNQVSISMKVQSLTLTLTVGDAVRDDCEQHQPL